jgi:hypothetical protein
VADAVGEAEFPILSSFFTFDESDICDTSFRHSYFTNLSEFVSQNLLAYRGLIRYPEKTSVKRAGIFRCDPTRFLIGSLATMAPSAMFLMDFRNLITKDLPWAISFLQAA